jgi:CDP-diacylglycerol--glycerol-3-phosphate 3-phosphatidyltransferase
MGKTERCLFMVLATAFPVIMPVLLMQLVNGSLITTVLRLRAARRELAAKQQRVVVEASEATGNHVEASEATGNHVEASEATGNHVEASEATGNHFGAYTDAVTQPLYAVTQPLTAVTRPLIGVAA